MKLGTVASCALALALSACGGSQPPPADPSLEEPSASSGSGSGGPSSAPASNASVEKAMSAIQSQDFAGAKSTLEQARKDDPKDPQAAFYLGVANEGLGDKAGAKEAYKAAIGLDPKLPDPAVNLSQLLLDDNDAAGALAVVDTALKSLPKHPDLLLNRAVALEAVGKKDEALSAYATAAGARPKDMVLHAAYGQLLMEAGKKDEGLGELKKASASDDPALLASIASVQTKAGAFDDCIATINRAMEKKKIPALLVRRGMCEAGKKDDKAAEADYQAALAMDADFAPAHHYLGLQLAAKDKKAALEHLDKAAALAGDKGIGPEAKKKAAELRGKK
ncbi:MAG TPA: tetratricopeptide repeat protein [Polyangiaceae bacterium]|nr:tetratricopeptide repeat protein [Polyangiaceae bacterium]